jgi:hypothetical protein
LIGVCGTTEVVPFQGGFKLHHCAVLGLDCGVFRVVRIVLPLAGIRPTTQINNADLGLARVRAGAASLAGAGPL